MSWKKEGNALVARVGVDAIGFTPAAVWNPSPSSHHHVAPYPTPMTLAMGIRDTDQSGAKYSPPPYAVIVESAGKQAFVGVTADAGWHRWNEAVFEVSASGVVVKIDLENRTDPATIGEHLRMDVIPGQAGESRHALLARGLKKTYPAASEGTTVAPWWRRPIYCGWGDQVTVAMKLEGQGQERRALSYCLQGLYERWINRLDEAEVPFGTVTIDAGWSLPGVWEPTETMWPDLRGFIDRQHAKGRKVLLWIATWFYEGLPDEWCIYRGGRKITADPTHPDYIAFIQEKVHKLLSPAGYDADGFKIDQLRYTPTYIKDYYGPRFAYRDVFEAGDGEITMHGDGWGTELLHTLQKAIYDAAKGAKADSLITSSTVHPYFHDTFDMVRIHDMGYIAPDIFEAMKSRVDLGRAALPGKLVDTDDWIHTDYEMWLKYTTGSHVLGVPCIFYAEHFMADWKGKAPTKQIPLEDLRQIGDAWRAAGLG